MEIPAGLFDKNFEWISPDKIELYGFYDGRKLSFDEVPFRIKLLFYRLYLKEGNPKCMLTCKDWLIKNFGIADSTPDLDVITGQINKENYAEKLHLTDRQVEVVKGVASGKPDKQIADELSISYETLRVHKKEINKKTGLHCKVQLTNLAYKYSFV